MRSYHYYYIWRPLAMQIILDPLLTNPPILNLFAKVYLFIAVKNMVHKFEMLICSRQYKLKFMAGSLCVIEISLSNWYKFRNGFSNTAVLCNSNLIYLYYPDNYAELLHHGAKMAVLLIPFHQNSSPTDSSAAVIILRTQTFCLPYLYNSLSSHLKSCSCLLLFM